MRLTRRESNSVFEDALSQLSKAGVTPSPLETVWLFDLSREVLSPGVNERPAFLWPGVCIGGVTLYPPTLAAEMWMSEYASRWFRDDEDMDIKASAWACAVGRVEGVFEREAQTELRARATIGGWSRKVTCTLQELRAAVLALSAGEGMERITIECIGEVKQQHRTVSAAHWGEIISALVAAYHLPPGQFLWGMSADDAMMMLANRPGPNGEMITRKDAKSAAVHALQSAIRHLKMEAKRKAAEQSTGADNG